VERVGYQISDKSVRKHGLQPQEYYFVTLHREENVSNKERLENVLKAIYSISEHSRVIFPIHPHTRKNIRKYRLTKYLRKSIVIEPVGYMEGLAILRNASTVLTDSGGIQQEAAILGTPCVTMRNETEWIETVQAGLNFLAGTETERILDAVRKIHEDRDEIERNFKRKRCLFGRPPVSPKIADIIETMATTD
jgi:UDP-N-acetylglucosamine 2-epimerase